MKAGHDRGVILARCTGLDYTFDGAAVVVEGVTVAVFATEATTMLVIGLILSGFSIGLFCWLIFTLAIYALPFFIGLTAGIAAFRGGAGVLGGFVCGIAAGALTFVLGQVAFATARHSIFRILIAAAFATPAALAGYHAVLGLSQIGVPSLIWREIFAWIGAIPIGGTAWARMTALAEPLPTRVTDRCRLGEADPSRGIRQRHECAESGQFSPANLRDNPVSRRAGEHAASQKQVSLTKAKARC